MGKFKKGGGRGRMSEEEEEAQRRMVRAPPITSCIVVVPNNPVGLDTPPCTFHTLLFLTAARASLCATFNHVTDARYR